jgi:CRISPR-associated protein Cas6
LSRVTEIMFWQESNESKDSLRHPKDIFDIAFRLKGERLRTDHAFDLARELEGLLTGSCFSSLGIHRIRMAASGNGWNNSDDNDSEMLLSKRTRLVLRVGQASTELVLQLNGQSLSLYGDEFIIGAGSIRPLVPIDTLFARALISDPEISEPEFLSEVAGELRQQGIQVSKMMCGKSSSFLLDDKRVFTRSLMVAGLNPEQSIQLQRQGLGQAQQFGCGIFVPHKGVEAVYVPQD